MIPRALLFIPDISGFTQFIARTEIEHSRHIIAELLEIILASNRLDLRVSEIEGDAILFYRSGAPPTRAEVLQQSRDMFVAFHTHLKVIDRNRVCQCGACATAANLTLKCIVHYGEVHETPVGQFTKLMGTDVILAHRLLKNSLTNHEYVLLSPGYRATQKESGSGKETWAESIIQTEEVQDFGPLEVEVVSLSPLHVQVAEPPVKKSAGEFNAPDRTLLINAPVQLVHELLTDNFRKPEYVDGVKEIRQDEPMNRIGGSHTCVFDDLEVHFVTKTNTAFDGGVRFVEEGHMSFGVDFVSDYLLSERNGATLFSVRKVYLPAANNGKNFMQRWFRAIKSRVMFTMVKRSSYKGLHLFKEFCEEEHLKRQAAKPMIQVESR